ncbi:monovalent cation:proton antiporter family protein [Pleionea sediminis]|uniref:monovalent cation:proton antiporter family protein n=1 Tax=Pleionea sediminis TaxID=2569479 RepID=UPI0011846ED4|nr:monovalent cation:proton antiporter family protein [Pleionea sediminis]
MHHAIYAQILLTLAASVLLVALFRRINLPTILAYLVVGLFLGQMGLEFFAPNSNAYIIAEVGVVFMLFTLGLEFSLPRVIAMKTQVLGLGSLQVVLCILFYFIIASLFKLDWTVSLVIASALAMSSTAIVTKQLDDQQEVNHRHGILSIATLLFQDMAAVPLLILVPILASAEPELITSTISLALLKGTIAFLIIIAFGKWLLPKLFHEVASSHSDELFVMTSLTVALVASWFTQWLGLSMALGAFMAGMLLAESQFKHQIETEIRPFRDILLGLFFITIGTLIDIELLFHHTFLILGLLIAFMISKLGLILVIARVMKESFEDAFKASLILSHAGELGFVLIGLARQQNILNDEVASIILSVGVLSMFISPFLIRYSTAINNLLFPKSDHLKQHSASKRLISEAVKGFKFHVIICGFGRNGQTIKRFLDRMDIVSVVLDLDPVRVKEASTAGEAIFYGDATRKSILNAAEISNARLVIVTFDNPKSTMDLLATTRHNYPHVPVLVRTKDDSHLEKFLQNGATKVIPESLESCLMLVGQVLYTLGLPLKQIIEEIQSVRDDRYHLLQSFFHGSSSDLMRVLQTHHEQLHAVVLTGNAFAIGKAINEIELPEKTCIEAVKRGKTSFTPPDRNLMLQLGDIVLLSGEPDYIEHAENRLFSG